MGLKQEEILEGGFGLCIRFGASDGGFSVVTHQSDTPPPPPALVGKLAWVWFM